MKKTILIGIALLSTIVASGRQNTTMQWIACL
jgi:hypothetical protein